MRVPLLGALLLIPGLAFAAGKPQPADKHEPALYADEGGTWINVVGSASSYRVKATFRVFGAQNRKDRTRIELHAGGKIIGQAACSTSDFAEKAKALSSECEIETPMTTVGPVDVQVIFADDQTDTEYLVTTYHLTVRSWKSIGKATNWGVLPDDLLAVAYARHWHGGSVNRHVLFEFWSTNGSLAGGDATLRCTVNGQKVPDFDAHIDGAHANQQREIEVGVTTPKEHRTYSYDHYDVTMDLRFGPKEKVDNIDPERLKWLADTAGAWDCMLRKQGHAIRELMFTVNADGMVEPSEMQKGAHAVKTAPNVALIDMKIPADNGVEKRIRPDAMKKSIGFGVPWPDSAKSKELQAALPPSSGLPD